MAAGEGRVCCYVMNEPFQFKYFSLATWLLRGACAPVDGPIPIQAALMRLIGLILKKEEKKRKEEKA